MLSRRKEHTFLNINLLFHPTFSELCILKTNLHEKSIPFTYLGSNNSFAS